MNYGQPSGCPISGEEMIQLTFTEQEAKDHADFINFIYTNGKWELTTAEVMKLAVMFNKMHSFQKKVDEHVMELKEVIEKPKEEKKPAARAKK